MIDDDVDDIGSETRASICCQSKDLLCTTAVLMIFFAHICQLTVHELGKPDYGQ